MKKRTTRKKDSGWLHVAKLAGLAIGGILASLLLVVGVLWLWAGGEKTPPEEIAWGVTYSAHAAKDLDLNVESTYVAMLDELKPKKVRLMAYWNDIEPREGVYDYSDLDFQVREAEKRAVPYVIAVGRKVPRYPECFVPEWAQKLPESDQQPKILAIVERTVKRYDKGAHLASWQVENEPFLDFGECPEFDEKFLKQEVALVRSLTSKPMLMTDSGELSLWLGPTKYGDEFGSTLYRVVITENEGDVFHHFLWPEVYTRHGNLIKKLRPNVKKVVVAELQAEPWGNGPDKPQAFYDKTMSHEQMLENIRFAQEVGFPEVYMWGVEWWYYEKQHGVPAYWDTARKLFAGKKL